jgi:phosphatidylserine/phosphatidylglycerophosphate/cardiolipin synthase-like enzyme
VTEALVAAIGKAVSSLSDGVLDSLERLLGSNCEDAAVLAAAPTDASREHVLILLAAREEVGADKPAVALAIAAARERERAAQVQRVSVVWTGPETFAVPVRRTDQALLQLINMARERLIVVSFAVYKVPEVAAALIACSRRGCDVAIVVESEAESGGKVTFEMSKALGSEVAEHARLYTWPHELRPDVGSGKVASLHAKCAVADRERLLVSSANLTEYAFTKNMELGLLVEGGDVPHRVQSHLETLFEQNVLRRIVATRSGLP